MKYLYLLILLLLLSVVTSAQTSTDSSGLTVLQKKWKRSVVKNPENIGASKTDPFEANNEANKANKTQGEYLRDRKIQEAQGRTVVTPPGTVTKMGAPRSSFSSPYNYQIKVQNKGVKTIQKVSWEYVFFDPTTNQQVGKQGFISLTNLKPGKTDTLSEILYLPPTNSVNVTGSEKKLSKLYNEQINIISVQYTDGSIWQADSN